MAYEPTHVVVGLGDPVTWGLVSTGRRDGGRVYRAFQMAEDLADHLALREAGVEPQHPLVTPGAACHLQAKDPLQQPRPTPARRLGVRLLAVHPLLPECREDRPTQLAVRRQTAAIAHQMDVWQGDQGC